MPASSTCLMKVDVMSSAEATQVVAYKLENMVVEVCCQSEVEACAVRDFAKAGGFPCPAPENATPVYRCHAKTHPGGEVLW